MFGVSLGVPVVATDEAPRVYREVMKLGKSLGFEGQPLAMFVSNEVLSCPPPPSDRASPLAHVRTAHERLCPWTGGEVSEEPLEFGTGPSLR